MWVFSDGSDMEGTMMVFCLILICVIIGFAIKLLGPSLGASEEQYKKDIERIIILSNENERRNAKEQQSGRKPVTYCGRQ